ncbi:hypothetical protein ACGFIV_25825 [Sphaerisporangium sp. NPDC049003]|uniref:hypothetical protein n=1 Tax=Sphaerisporangium sp. NPDC049003 TaxID=3364517 RepID=UPI0037196668
MRRATIVMACLLAGACASPAASGEPKAPGASAAPARPATSASVAPGGTPRAQGGCGDTPVQSGGPPAWAAENAPGTRFVLGREGDALGYLFADPLRAGTPTSPSNKILWYVRLPRDSQDLRVVAHPRGAERPVVRAAFPSDSGPGEIYPSVTDVPEPGCWTFELTWGAHHDTVDLLYRR